MLADYMQYSDRIVLLTIKKLVSIERRPLTISDIVRAARVPERTVKVSVSRLIQDGKIRRDGGGRRWGYIYEVLDD